MEDNTKADKSLMFKHAAYYGIIMGLVLILLTCVDYAFKIYGQNKFLAILGYIVLIAGVFTFTILYRNKALGGYITYGQSLVFGILLVVFASIISGVFTFVLNIVDPAYIATQLDMAADKMAQSGLSDAQIDQALSLTRKLMSPAFILISAVFGGVIMGTIFSLITSIFTKKQKSIF